MVSTTTLRPLSIGEILDGAFTLYRRHLGVILGTALVLHFPYLLLMLASPIAAAFVGAFFVIAAWTAAVWQYSEAVLGREPEVRRAIAVALRKFFPALAMLMLVYILIFLGMLLLIIPGILLGIRYFAVLPALVLEDSSHPLRRSGELSRDARGKIFIAWIIASVIAAIPFWALQAYGIIVGANALTGEAQHVQVMQVVLSALVTPFSSGVITLLYYDQRVRKEGLDVKLAISDAAALGPAAAPPRGGPA
jgi:hypothetical protein